MAHEKTERSEVVETVEVVIGPSGDARCVYTEAFDLTLLGEVAIRRASRVEPDGSGRWWADLSPSGGPTLGPFDRRSGALAAELSWLRLHALFQPPPRQPAPGRLPEVVTPTEGGVL